MVIWPLDLRYRNSNQGRVRCVCGKEAIAVVWTPYERHPDAVCENHIIRHPWNKQ